MKKELQFFLRCANRWLAKAAAAAVQMIMTRFDVLAAAAATVSAPALGVVVPVLCCGGDGKSLRLPTSSS